MGCPSCIPTLGGRPTEDSAQKHQRSDGRPCPQRQPLPAQACRPRVLSVAPSTLAGSPGPSTGGLGAADHFFPRGLVRAAPSPRHSLSSMTWSKLGKSLTSLTLACHLYTTGKGQSHWTGGVWVTGAAGRASSVITRCGWFRLPPDFTPAQMVPQLPAGASTGCQPPQCSQLAYAQMPRAPASKPAGWPRKPPRGQCRWVF